MKEGRLQASYDYDENVKLASSYCKGLSQLSVVLFLFYTMRIRDRWQMTSPSRHSHNLSTYCTPQPRRLYLLHIYMHIVSYLYSLKKFNNLSEESKTTTTTKDISTMSVGT